MQDQRLKFLDTRLLPLIIGLIAAEREYLVVSAMVTLLPCCRENVNKNWFKSDWASSVWAHTALWNKLIEIGFYHIKTVPRFILLIFGRIVRQYYYNESLLTQIDVDHDTSIEVRRVLWKYDIGNIFICISIIVPICGHNILLISVYHTLFHTSLICYGQTYHL